MPEYLALRENIRANGLRDHELITYEGKLLDGRHRYRAFRDLGIEPIFQTFAGTADEALAFVVSRNLHRRHLDESRGGLRGKLSH